MPPAKRPGMLACEISQTLQVGDAERLEMAQHQGQHLTARRFAHRQFNLGTGFARIHGEHQRTQRHQQCTHGLRQHEALLHVGNKAALAFMETHQHLALLADKPHRQACTIPVGPLRPLDRAQDVLGPNLAQMPQVVFQDPLLHGHLSGSVQVLHLATAAGTFMQSEMRASRLHALRRRLVHHGEHRLLETGLAAAHLDADPLKRKRALDKHHLAVVPVGNSLRVDVQRLDQQLPIWLRGCGLQRMHHPASHLGKCPPKLIVMKDRVGVNGPEGTLPGRPACPGGAPRSAA